MAANKRINQNGWKSRTAVSPRSVYFWVGFSILCHSGLLAALVLLPDLAPAKKITGSVINVSLVSVPAKGQPAVPVSKPAVKAVKKKAPASRAEQSPKSASQAPRKIAPKKSLKKKTYSSTKVVKSAVSKLEEKVADARPPSLDQALDRLKTQVEQTETNPRQAVKATEDDDMRGSGGTAVTGLSEAETRDRIRIYQAEIAYQIQKNWAFSEQIADLRDELEAALGITILLNGEIKDVWFDRRSGNRHLDESAYRAIKKSSPLPPLPRGLFKTEYTVGLIFGPKGLK